MLPETPEIRRFRSSKPLTEGLKELLENRTIITALEALDTLSRPRGVPAFTPGTPHDTTIAHEFCERAGVNSTLHHLRSMCYHIGERNPLDEVDDAPMPFSHAIPPNLLSADEH